MNPFEMVVAVIFLFVIGGVINGIFKASERAHERKANESSVHEAGELREMILTLEDRVRVLERIVTDTSGREDLMRQFRELER